MRITLITVAATLLLAGTAAASRAPTSAEKGAILDGFHGWSDASCYTVRVSTVDHAWARVGFTSKRSDETPNEYVDRCNPADGLTVMHRRHSAWRRVAAGSDFRFCPVKRVPTAVAVDLKICKRRHG